MYKQLRVLTTGGRKWTDRSLIEDAILDVDELVNGDLIVCHGASPGGGADWIVDEVCKTNKIEVVQYPVSKQDGPWPAAGVRRNQRMLNDFRPTFAIAFPDPKSRGTWDMVDRLIKAKVNGWIVYPDRHISWILPK